MNCDSLMTIIPLDIDKTFIARLFLCTKIRLDKIRQDKMIYFKQVAHTGNTSKRETPFSIQIQV